MVRFITRADADTMLQAMKARPQASVLVPFHREDWAQSGIVGLHTIDYYVVPDDDPRVSPPQHERLT
jgi:hypothetical protein